MTHILIADGGSTKSAWTLLKSDGTVSGRLVTAGINPVHAADKSLYDAMANVKPLLGDIVPDKIFYYGAGCMPHLSGRVKEAIAATTGTATSEIDVESDLLGAARALLVHKPGIVCILGTGSNSALYDGEKITSNIPALGYILGDEGSGAVLGRRLVGDVLKQVFPPVLCKAFFHETGLTTAEIIDRVYRRPEPNSFLASLVPFLSRHIERPHVRHLVTRELLEFMSRNVARYPGYEKKEIACCGSIAANFTPQLHRAAYVAGCTISRIEASPMDGLIAYHTQDLKK